MFKQTLENESFGKYSLDNRRLGRIISNFWPFGEGLNYSVCRCSNLMMPTWLAQKLKVNNCTKRPRWRRHAHKITWEITIDLVGVDFDGADGDHKCWWCVTCPRAPAIPGGVYPYNKAQSVLRSTLGAFVGSLEQRSLGRVFGETSLCPEI